MQQNKQQKKATVKAWKSTSKEETNNVMNYTVSYRLDAVIANMGSATNYEVMFAALPLYSLAHPISISSFYLKPKKLQCTTIIND